jgi:predicted dehydrogenase
VPARASGFAHLGKYHDIEVEDEVTAYFEHENGMVGHFIVTAAESPGTNRLEIVGENGTLVYEKGALAYLRNRVSMLSFSKLTNEAFGKKKNLAHRDPVRRGR